MLTVDELLEYVPAYPQRPSPEILPTHVLAVEDRDLTVQDHKDAAGVRFVSRNGRDLTRRFPEVATAPEGLEPRTLILDGEIAVFDRQYARGNDLRARPLRVRRNVLEELVDGQHLVLPGAWLRGVGREGRRLALPGGPGNRLAQGEAAALPRGRARLGDEDVAI